MAVAFGAISLVVALLVSGATYLFARVYLVQEREAAALNRALIDTRVVDAAMSDRDDPARALGRIPATADSQAMFWAEGEWFSTNVTVAPTDLPVDLLSQAAESGGAWQRFSVDTGTFLAVAVPVEGGIFVEVFSFAELDQTLATLGWILVGAALLAFVVGGAVGRAAGVRLLRPLGDLASGARRITAGELSARVPVSEDPDLAAISTAFNEMADTVEDRIERERRFSGNVSHELRSPLTGILGTAELLEQRSDDLPEREANLVSALSSQVRRFSGMVLDLLEISRIGGDEIVQRQVFDLSRLVVDNLEQRGLRASIYSGTGEVLIDSDPRRCERIVANLIENAQRHGEGVRSISIQQVAHAVTLTVDDAGPGISEELASQIFEPFTRGDATTADGAGLGLAIVREQVRMLGGEVSVKQSPEGGARFTVTFVQKESR